MDLGDQPSSGSAWTQMGWVGELQDVRGTSNFVLLEAEHHLLLTDEGHFSGMKDISVLNYIFFLRSKHFISTYLWNHKWENLTCFSRINFLYRDIFFSFHVKYPQVIVPILMNFMLSGILKKLKQNELEEIVKKKEVCVCICVC